MKRTNEDYIAAAEFQVLSLLARYTDIEMREVDVHNFPHAEARALYRAIDILRDRQETITEGSLLREANLISDDVDAVTVNTVLSYNADLSNFNEATKTLKESSIKYQLGTVIDKINESVVSHDSFDSSAASALLYEAQEVIQNGQRKIVSKTLEHCISEYEEELNVRKEGKFHEFGDLFLDRALTRKASAGQVILIAGSTGTGKSTYNLNLINGMVNMGTPNIYFSLEMDTISTMDRLLAMRTGIPVENWYVSGNNIDALLKRVAEEKEILRDKPFRLIDDPDVSLADIRNIIRDFKMTYKEDYVCVFVDLITQVKDFTDMGSGRGSLANTIELAVNQLNGIAKKENCCIVAIAQMNREADNARITSIDDIDQLRPTINNVKNSHALGERARVVLSAFRPKYYAERLFPEAEELEFMPDVLQIQVLKQSQGSVSHTGKYLFDGPCFAVRPYVEESPSDEGVELNY